MWRGQRQRKSNLDSQIFLFIDPTVCKVHTRVLWWIGFIAVYRHSKVAILPSPRPGVSATWRASWNVSTNEISLQTQSLLTFAAFGVNLPLLVSMIHFMDSHVKNTTDSARHNCSVRDQAQTQAAEAVDFIAQEGEWSMIPARLSISSSDGCQFSSLSLLAAAYCG